MELVAALFFRLVAGAVAGRILVLRTGTPAERLARLKAESQEDLRAMCMRREFPIERIQVKQQITTYLHVLFLIYLYL